MKSHSLKYVPTSSLLADLKAERRGTRFINHRKTMAEIRKELKRRQKLGLIKKSAGKRRKSGYSFGYRGEVLLR